MANVFKVGDTVKLNPKGEQNYSSSHKGKYGTVTQLQEDGSEYVYVRFDGKSQDYYRADCLEKTKRKPNKFLLQYIRSSDPLELFPDVDTLKKRIVYLVEKDSGVDRTSFVIYPLGSAQKVEVSTILNFKKS